MVFCLYVGTPVEELVAFLCDVVVDEALEFQIRIEGAHGGSCAQGRGDNAARAGRSRSRTGAPAAGVLRTEAALVDDCTIWVSTPFAG